MRTKIHALVALACVSALALTACGDDADGDDKTGPITVGVLTSLTGPASATFQVTPKAVEARLEAYQAAGGKCAGRGFQVIDADDASSTEGALKAAQKLVQSDKVSAVITNSSFFYGPSQYLTTQAKGTPVFGGGFDGAPEWDKTDNNVFGVFPSQDFGGTYDTTGTFFKTRGVTKWAGIAFNSPSASKGLDAAKRSIEAAGIGIGYYNNAVPFGSTDVGAIVQGIIASGADGLLGALTPETSFGVIAGLRQAGYDKLKVIQLPTGYGADLLKSEPAVQASQGVTFSVNWVPTELQTAPALVMSEALKKYLGNESGVPSFSEAMGWLSTDLFLYALEKAGCDASRQEVIDAIRTDSGWDGGGLVADKRDFSTSKTDKQCAYYVTLKDHAFVPEPNATPLCGKRIG